MVVVAAVVVSVGVVAGAVVGGPGTVAGAVVDGPGTVVELVVVPVLVVPVLVVPVDPERLGNVGWSQQLVASRWGPDCGAWSKVTMIIPSCLYAGDASISGMTVFRNVSAWARPAGAPGMHGVSDPLWHASGAM